MRPSSHPVGDVAGQIGDGSDTLHFLLPLRLEAHSFEMLYRRYR
jgi:hypothetical protein